MSEEVSNKKGRSETEANNERENSKEIGRAHV